MEQSTEQWTILGAGAIGHLLACQFAKENLSATLICREQPAKEQIPVTYKAGDYSHSYLLNYQSVNDCAAVDNLLLTVKSHQVENAIDAIKSAIKPSSRIFLLQNGMGTVEKVSQLLAEQLDPCQIYPGTNTHGAYLQRHPSGTTELVHAGKGHLIFGNNFLQTKNQKQPECFNALMQLSLNASWVNDIERRLWLKLAVNAAINPLTAINNCLNGALLQSDTLENQLQLLCQETADLFRLMASNKQSNNNQAIELQQIIEEVYDVINKTSNNQSSMLQDRQLGKKTEIESITGYLLTKAKHHGIDMPQHQSLFHKIQNF